MGAERQAQTPYTPSQVRNIPVPIPSTVDEGLLKHDENWHELAQICGAEKLGEAVGPAAVESQVCAQRDVDSQHVMDENKAANRVPPRSYGPSSNSDGAKAFLSFLYD